MTAPPRILAIAGSDSSGGAGIQADIKTITMLGGYAMTAITAVTAQNTKGVSAVLPITAEMLIEQYSACRDIGYDAVKIGMLGSESHAGMLWDLLIGERGGLPVVFDPVMAATSGSQLADPRTITSFHELMEQVTLATPNLPELAALTDRTLDGIDDVRAAAGELAAKHAIAVLAKGGHAEGDSVIDILVKHDGSVSSFQSPRIDTCHTHGTGCTLSSAIATYLGMGWTLEQAIGGAREFVRAALLAAPGFGASHGPMGHHAVR